MKGRKFIDYLSDYQILKTDCGFLIYKTCPLKLHFVIYFVLQIFQVEGVVWMREPRTKHDRDLELFLCLACLICDDKTTRALKMVLSPWHLWYLAVEFHSWSRVSAASRCNFNYVQCDSLWNRYPVDHNSWNLCYSSVDLGLLRFSGDESVQLFPRICGIWSSIRLPLVQCSYSEGVAIPLEKFEV